MPKRRVHENAWDRLVFAALAVVLVLLCAHQTLRGQEQVTTATPPAFEAATVKPNTSGSGGSSTNSTNGLLRITNQTLQSMIQYAYNVRDFQIVGGPGWMRSDRYDVVAKPETGAHDQQMKAMLKTLLADRFQLQLHREMRPGAVYALVVGKNGSKLKPAEESPSSGTSSGRDPATGQSTLKGTRQSADELAANLAARVGRPVVNRTGLDGKFDFELSWAPDLTLTRTSGDKPPEVSGPSIFTAVQEQLGLRLESDKGEFEVLVIDKAERPTPERN